MKLIIGLGNPGQKYSRTKHNIGFAVIDCYARRHSLKWKEYKDIALINRNDCCLLVKPTVFMNNSGQGVMPFFKKFHPAADEMLVVHDDMDLAGGTIKFKTGGSAGGHNGVQSIINILGTPEFARLRVGIGRPPADVDAVEYVLSGFEREKSLLFKNTVEKSTDAVECFIEYGIVKAENIFNRKAEGT